MSRIFRVTLLVTGVVVSAPLLLSVEPRQGGPATGEEEASTVELLEEMRTTSELLVQSRMKEFLGGRGQLHELIAAQEKLFDIEMKIAETADARSEVLKKHLERVRAVERVVENRIRSGTARRSDLLECRLWRMNMELTFLTDRS